METLEVHNGVMTPKFESNCDVYTINIEPDIDCLELKYETEPDEMVQVYGNLKLQEGENKVLIAIQKKEELSYITLIVNKASREAVNQIEWQPTVNLILTRPPSYVPILIGSGSLSFLLLIFCLFFRRGHQ